jgi:RNA polymerase sigma-70 factor (ECF subfamily)
MTPSLEASPLVTGAHPEGQDEARGVERDLVIRAQRGDREAFAELTFRAGDHLLAIAQRILRDVDQAEDATQQTIVAIWRELPKLRDPDKFDGWSFRILQNACRAELRRDRRWSPTEMSRLPLDAEVGDPALRLADRDELERAFRRLPVEHRAVLVMQHYLGLTLEQIADRLEIPLGTARSRSHYAKRAMRAALEADARGAEGVRPA